jgi:hypothetical protein
MTLSAKYPGTCTKCSQPIVPGQKIEWAKGSRPTHTVCGGAPAAKAPAKAANPGVCACGRPIQGSYRTCYRCSPAARSRLPLGSGAGSAASVPGYSAYCTDNATCRCFDCAS